MYNTFPTPTRCLTTFQFKIGGCNYVIQKDNQERAGVYQEEPPRTHV